MSTVIPGRSGWNPLPLLGLLVVAIVAGMLLSTISISWRVLPPDRIPIDYTFNNHCRKHLGDQLDAWKIYDLLKRGQCAVEDRYCRTDKRNGPMMLWLCEDPVTGIIGGLFVILDKHQIQSGYGNDRSTYKYWVEDVIEEEGWTACP